MNDVFRCLECGAKVRGRECRKCGSTDIDLVAGDLTAADIRRDAAKRIEVPRG